MPSLPEPPPYSSPPEDVAASSPSPPNASVPEGMAARILELGEQLREEGVAVGTSELLDAFAVLREIPWTGARGLP